LEGFKEFEFFRGKVRFIQPKQHRLSVIEILFLSALKGIKKSHLVADLGAGFGALSIPIALKFNCNVLAIERDPTMLLLLRKNVENNHLQHRVEILEADVKEIDQKLKPQSVNCVVLNPPFYPKQSATENNPYHTEMYGKLEDFLRASAYILKDGGFINLLVPSFRLLEACNIMENLNIKPAYLKFFHSFIDKHAKLVRIAGVKNLNPKLVVESPLIINHKESKYTQEVWEILERFL